MKQLIPSIIFFTLHFYTLEGQNNSPFYMVDSTVQENLESTSIKFHERWLLNKLEAEKMATINKIPIRIEYKDGTVASLQRIENGCFIYKSTQNLTAAQTTSTDELWLGGNAGLNLSGSGITFGIWDGGNVRISHQELSGRVDWKDSIFISISDHSTHVAGTMVGAGINSQAKGMAYNGNLLAYDFDDDLAEMALEAANDLLLSNHSYGIKCGWSLNSDEDIWEYYGNLAIDPNEDYKFGFYNLESSELDELISNSVYYLPVVSAGNSRGEIGPTYGTDAEYKICDGGGCVTYPVIDTEPPGDNEFDDGFDCIPAGLATSKNALVVGSVNDIVGGYTTVSDIEISYFSAFGPTDDGRIKPDIVANGDFLFSSGGASNTAYLSMQGTSMAAPNVTGSLALLQEHYHNLNGNYLKSATLKAIVINTATRPISWPSYQSGWGLMNSEAAANLITENEFDIKIHELTLNNEENYIATYFSDGLQPIEVTIAWNDPSPLFDLAFIVDNPTSVLVNDLDVRVIRVSDGLVFYPFTLNKDAPNAAAQNNLDNNVDNVEFIYIDGGDLEPGEYQVSITHKGSLVGGNQSYGLVISGMQTEPYVDPKLLSEFEYWFDDNYLSHESGNTGEVEQFNFTQSVDVSNLTNGLHSFHIRFKDNNNLWSSALTQFFVKTQTGVAENVINSCEYWFDNNYLGKIDLTGINASTFNFNENVDVTSLTDGLHSFHMRFKDANNLWSSVVTQFFVKVKPINTPNLISTYEYWFDSDPYANVNTIVLPVAVNPFNLNEVVDVTDLTEADHVIHYRFKDINGKWSSVVTDTFSREPFIVADFSATPTSVCFGNSVSFTNNSEGATNYLWEFGDGITSTALEPTHTYALGGEYSVTLTVTNTGNGLSDVKSLANSIIVIEPNPIITPSGPTTICNGSNITLSTGTGFTSYQWYKGAAAIPGATNSTYTTNKAGSYSVKVFQGLCSKLSTPSVVTVNASPNATISNADISETNDLCVDPSIKLKANSGAGFTYQWYKGASSLAGATSQIYFATTTGNYKVKVTAPSGCNKTSSPYPIVKPCREADTIESISQLIVFPNPNDGRYTLEFNSACNTELTITIYDAVGKLILEDVGKLENNLFSKNYDLSEYAKGSYLVKVVCDEGAHYVNVIVQ